MTIGVGLLMFAQIEILESMRDEADQAGAFWRGLGHLTFGWQDETTQSALLAHEMPAGYLAEAEIVAFSWFGAGFVCLLTLWWLGPSGK